MNVLCTVAYATQTLSWNYPEYITLPLCDYFDTQVRRL